MKSCLKENEELTSNIENEESTQNLIRKTLQNLSDVLSKSLGPYGSTSILQSSSPVDNSQAVITKDGYTIVNKVHYTNMSSNIILDFIKKISKNLVSEVGDGSTSAIIIANTIYKFINNIQNSYNISSKDLIDILEIIFNILQGYVKKISRPITEDNLNIIEDIANISLNNDIAGGKLIYELYQKIGLDGFITLKLSNTDSDYYSIQKGMKLDRGFIDSMFATSQDKEKAVFKKPKVFVTNDVLTEQDFDLLMDLSKIALESNIPLIIVSKGFDEEVRNFFLINKSRAKEKFNILPIAIALRNNLDYEKLDDLIVYLGGKLFDKRNSNQGVYESEKDFEELKTMLGSCEEFNCTATETKFISGLGKKADVIKRIDKITQKLIKYEKHTEENNDTKIYDCKKRIANLQCSVAVLYIGGATLTEKFTRKYLFEDAVLACKSAIEYGYITGGNLEIPRIIDQNFQDIVDLLLEKDYILPSINKKDKNEFYTNILLNIQIAFSESFKKVLDNKKINSEESDVADIISKCIKENLIYNLKTDKYETIEDTTIINSANTDIAITKATFSIVSLLATSNQLILNI